jgi:hypothetical protein
MGGYPPAPYHVKALRGAGLAQGWMSQGIVEIFVGIDVLSVACRTRTLKSPFKGSLGQSVLRIRLEQASLRN